jgi:hypothetical protein
MSKKDLKNYLSGLTKKQLENQIIDIYDRFKPVKEFYDYTFKPNDEKLINEAKFKFKKEYFPEGKRKPKKRRSISQKIIKKYISIGVEPYVIIDLMLFNIEIALEYSNFNNMSDSFFVSMLKSFNDAITYSRDNVLYSDFKTRFEQIASNAWEQNWINKQVFENSII